MQTQNIVSENQSTLQRSKTVVVVCAADDKYSMPLAVVARSALENLDRNYKMRFFVIDGGITDANKQKILRSLNSDHCQVEFIPKPDTWIKSIEDVLKQLKKESPPETQHILSTSSAAYYRLFIPELLPKEIDRAIYLDCDLVVKGDLKELWEAAFQDNCVLAVQDIWSPYVSQSIELPYQKLGIPADTKYFNSGVLVVDLEKWRNEEISVKAIEYLKRNGGCPRTQDQGVLNAMLACQWGELDQRWNMTPAIVDLFSSWKESPFSEEVYNRLLHEPLIIHFATNRKPWNSRHTFLKDTFFEYVDKTAWLGWRLTFWRRLQIAITRESKKFLNRFS